VSFVLRIVATLALERPEMQAITADRSESDRCRKYSNGIATLNGRPSWETRRRMARSSCSSVRRPIPVSASGVTFGATTRDPPAS